MRSLFFGGLPLGKLFGIKVTIHWSLLLLAIVFGPTLGAASWLLVGILFFSIFLHEMGHCAAARSVGEEAHEILMWPLGGLAFTSGGRTPLQSLWISLGGPLVHLPIAALCAYLLYNSGLALTWAELNPLSFELLSVENVKSQTQIVLYLTFKIQLLLFAFNVFLPAYPMDGGQILTALLAFDYPLKTTLKIIFVTTLLSMFALFYLEIRVIGACLFFSALGLLNACQDGKEELHPIARLFQNKTVAAKRLVYVPPGYELVNCASCGAEMHPRSGQCVECGSGRITKDEDTTANSG